MNGQYSSPNPGGHVNGRQSQGGTPLGPNFQIQVPRLPTSSPHYRYDPRMHAPPGAYYPPQTQHSGYPQQNVSYSQYNQNSVRPSYVPNPDRGFSSYSNPSAQMQNWPPPIDYQRLLLSLAEEFFAAAYGKASVSAAAQGGPALDQYYKLIATGLGCLESALKNHRLEPIIEATIRLRYAQILFQETENYSEAEEVLSNGISLCDRHRLHDMKYNMQHLLARAMFVKSPKASLNFLDDIIDSVTTYQHVIWIYTFRFLRVSLSLRTSTPRDTLIAHLKAIVEVAIGRGDYTVAALASINEAIIHLRRSSSVESIEQAQRAIAAARSSQLNPASHEVPQLIALINFADIACTLQRNDSVEGMDKMKSMQEFLDLHIKDKRWSEDGMCTVPACKETAKSLPGSGLAAGVVRFDGNDNLSLVLSWLPRAAVYAVGYILSGSVIANRNAFDGKKSEQYLEQALRVLEGNAATKQSGSLHTLTTHQTLRQSLICQARLQLAFALCVRSAYSLATSQLNLIHASLSRLPSPPDSIQPTAIYLSGVIAQANGDLPTALAIFQTPSLTLPALESARPQQAPPNLTIRILATLSTLLILRTPSHPQHNLMPTILASLQPHFSPSTAPSSNKALLSAYHLVLATSYPASSPPTMIKTKQYLQSALTAARAVQNNQLMVTTLSFMGWKYFKGVIAEQSEKSAKTCQALARKGGDPVWKSVCAGTLADTLEIMGKGEEAEICRREALELADGLPASMARVKEEA